jgi:hypothetical protein
MDLMQEPAAGASSLSWLGPSGTHSLALGMSQARFFPGLMVSIALAFESRTPPSNEPWPFDTTHLIASLSVIVEHYHQQLRLCHRLRCFPPTIMKSISHSFSSL